MYKGRVMFSTDAASPSSIKGPNGDDFTAVKPHITDADRVKCEQSPMTLFVSQNTHTARREIVASVEHE